jgi:single-strand DNA-binding protein
MSLPNVTVTGVLTGDPELRFTQSGKAVTGLRVAATERKKTDAGWVDGDTCYLDVSLWGAKAEVAAEQLTKGSVVTVVGSLKQQEWTDRNDNKRTSYSVTTNDVAVVIKAKAATRTQQQPADDPFTNAAPPF